MTLIEFIDKYRGNEKLTVKEMTEFFNKLEPEDRLDFLSELEDSERKKFIKDIRQQAVKDFWWHERQAIMDGTCTRDWSPEQIEIIMNINEKNGKMSTNAAKGLVLDDEGGYIIDKKGNKSYYGHHMVDVSTHPEFAGEWRNIQALDYDEHYDGAHPKHDTKTPTVGYYDVETGDTEVIDVDAKKFSFEKHVKYPPKRPCVFQSNENMEKIYSNFGKLTDAEKLALKNVDLASRTGDIQRFNAGIDLAQRYNSTDFINKIGLKTDAEIKQMYGVLNNCNDPDIINQYRLYEYSTRHGYQMDAVIYVDKDGNILGTSLDKTYIPDSNDYQLSMTESTKCLSNTELKSHSNLVKVEDAKAEAAKEIGDADKGESADKDKEVEDTGKTEEGSKETEDKDKTEEGSKETGDTDKGTDTDKSSETGDTDKGSEAGRDTDSVTDIDKGKDTGHGTGDTPETPEYTNRNHLLDGSSGNDGTKVELSENSKKLIASYETASGQKISTDFSPDMIKKVNKYADMLDFAGDALDLVDAGVSIYQAVNLFKNGDTNAGCKVLSDYGFSTLGGMGASALATGLVGMCALNPVVGFAFVFAAGFAGSELGKNFSEWWFEEVLGLYDNAGAYTYPVDPLILDLDGDGIETVSLEKGVNFDFDNNGFAEKTGWIGKDDALLVHDINKNGQIDNGSELFGDLTTVDETVASNGFEALKLYDKNQDGIINSSDEIYSELQLWKDGNQNGKVDANELLSLSQLGITGFNLNYENINIADENGNSHTQKSTYIKSDGTMGTLEDVWFQKDSADTIAMETNQAENLLEETEAIRKLPDIQGYGNQHSLHQAMLQDKTGELQKLIEDYVAESDLAKRKSMVTQIIYVWTGVAEESTTARGSNISDSRKLEALEVITGREFNSAYGKNPVYQAGQYIEQAFNKLVEMYYAQLERQTTYSELYQHLYQNMDMDAQGNISYDTKEIIEIFTEAYAQDKKAGKEQIVKFFGNMKNCGMFQWINTEELSTQLTVCSTDILHEIDYAGNDVLTGTNNNDVLNGELGNDTLQGGHGDDTYVFEAGDGADTIAEGGGSDKIVFGEGIKEEDILISRDSWNLYLTNKTNGEKITVKDFFYNTSYVVEGVEFADGSKWSLDDIKDKARYYYGGAGNDNISASDSYYYSPTLQDDYMYGGAGNDTLSGNNGKDSLYGEAGNDTLYGGNGSDSLYGETGNDRLYGGNDNDILNGGEGNDSLFGENGNDTLTGGAGNDHLDGSYGADTYIFNKGDGKDTIYDYDSSTSNKDVLEIGTDAKNLTFARSGSNLLVSIIDTQDTITIQNWYQNNNYKIETINTGDGYTLSHAQVDLLIQSMASFESSSGMSWMEGVLQGNKDIDTITNQIWVRQTEQ